MAQNVTIAGASYPAVPGIEVPITNGGGATAYFADTSPTTATDADVAQGKIYFKADGSQSVGTGSGGGAIRIDDTPDPAGGTVRTITAVQISGTKQITQNGVQDVTEYAAVNVQVPSSGADVFTVTLTQNTTTKYWVPNKTFAEISAAYSAGDTIIVSATNEYDEQLSTSCKFYDNEFSPYFEYHVTWFDYQDTGYLFTDSYSYSANGLDRYEHMEYGAPTTLVQKEITANGTYNPILTDYADGYSLVTVNVPSSGGTYQDKTHITPTESSQTITPDQNYDALSSVQIDPISSDYVGSGVTRRTYNDMEVNGATVTAPAGYYASSSGKSVASGSATAPASISGTSATVSTGTNTLTLTKTVSVTPSVTAGYVSSGTAGNSSVSLQASVTTKGAATIHPSTSDQTIASGTYTTGAQTIKGVLLTNLSADNIKNGVTVTVGDSTDADCVASVTGTYSGGGSSKAIYKYEGLASRHANSYGATSATVTVAKAGTYNISYVAIRGSSSGTMGTNLHIGSTEKGNNTTWNNGTYGQYVSYTSQSIAANTAVTIYATSGSNSRYIYVGQLIVEEV